MHTDTQKLDVPDYAKIYKSVRENNSDYAAAFFLKQGGGFVGFLGDTKETCHSNPPAGHARYARSLVALVVYNANVL